MGCDIHQYNLIWRDGKWLKEGEDVCEFRPYKYDAEIALPETGCFTAEALSKKDVFTSLYHSDYVPELCPGRNYSIFGILAGVRSMEYVIYDWDCRHDGYPSLSLPRFKKMFEKISDDRHSPVWYTLAKLDKALKSVSAAVRLDKKLAKFSDERRVLRWLLCSLREMRKKLKTAREELGRESFEKSIVIFNFDS